MVELLAVARLRVVAGRGWLRVRERPAFAQAVDAACDARDAWFEDEIAAAGAGATSARARQRMTAALVKQALRLRKRPGWKRGTG
jgi:hypothetical protein